MQTEPASLSGPEDHTALMLLIIDQSSGSRQVPQGCVHPFPCGRAREVVEAEPVDPLSLFTKWSDKRPASILFPYSETYLLTPRMYISSHNYNLYP